MFNIKMPACMMVLIMMFTGCNLQPNISEVHIISTNNLYGYALSGGTDRIGYDDLLAYTNFLREEGKHVILADAGNYLYGSIFVKLSEGQSAIEASLLAGYDVLAVGNHEFDFGGNQLLSLKKLYPQIPLTSANITFLGKNPFSSYQIIELGEDLRVAVVSAMSMVSFDKIQQDKVNGWDLFDPLTILKDLDQELKDKADAIILLGNFDNQDSMKNLVGMILEQMPSISLIIDTIDYDAQKINKKRVINSPDSAYGFHHTTLQFKDKRLINSESTLIVSEELKAFSLNYDDPRVIALQQYMSNIQMEVDDYFKNQLFSLPIKLDGQEELVRKGETDLTRVITDSFRYATDADIAVLNAGAIRSSLQSGPVTYGDLYNVLPYDNAIVTITIMGKDIYHAIEQSVQTLPASSSAFLHFSGLTYSYDLTQAVGQRVSNVMIGDEQLILNKNYTLAMNKFLASGGDGYSMFNRPINNSYGIDIDILSSYMMENKQALQNAQKERIFKILVDG